MMKLLLEAAVAKIRYLSALRIKLTGLRGPAGFIGLLRPAFSRCVRGARRGWRY
ncbi:hypothetical protein AB4Z48_19110 [Cupriavidus sp. 2TAF22]|uniref:hypothetical protein n=1 Tax=unclassified Cupriavidus TaxID=2640874 RepID=UPI003F927C3F